MKLATCDAWKHCLDQESKARILAVVLHPADVQDIVIPEKEKKEE